jgi:hypothetical protein
MPPDPNTGAPETTEEKAEKVLGVKPRYIHDLERIYELVDGIERFTTARRLPKAEWFTELRGLIAGLPLQAS